MARGRFRLKPSILDKLLERVDRSLESKKSEIEESLIFPELIERLNAYITNLEEFKHPGYNDFLLVIFVLLALKIPVTKNQIYIFLTMIFPHFYLEIELWKKKIKDQMKKEMEFVEIEDGGSKKYKINEIIMMGSTKMLEDFTRMPHNLRALNESAFDKRLLPALFPTFNWNL